MKTIKILTDKDLDNLKGVTEQVGFIVAHVEFRINHPNDKRCLSDEEILDKLMSLRELVRLINKEDK